MGLQVAGNFSLIDEYPGGAGLSYIKCREAEIDNGVENYNFMDVP
jgi:hypothetical protein